MIYASRCFCQCVYLASLSFLFSLSLSLSPSLVLAFSRAATLHLLNFSQYLRQTSKRDAHVHLACLLLEAVLHTSVKGIAYLFTYDLNHLQEMGADNVYGCGTGAGFEMTGNFQLLPGQYSTGDFDCIVCDRLVGRP